MGIKIILQIVAEKLTGRKCSHCKYNRAGRCCHPDGRMFMKCWHSVTRPGYEYSESVFYHNTAGQAATDGLQAGLAANLTEEEHYQLQKIKASLQEAEDIARKSGLLED